MAILMPSTIADSTHWATTKKSFNKFTTGTSMSDVHVCVIDNLIVNAVEKPSINANTDNNELGMLIVDNNGATTWAKAGTDYMSPNSTATLATNQTINLGTAGYISGNGDGQLVTLSATTINADAINVLGTNALINATSIEAGSFQGGTGSFTTVTATTQINTPVVNAAAEVNTPLVIAPTVNTSIINGTGTDGALSINTNGQTVTVNGTIAATQLKLDGQVITKAAIPLLYISTDAPVATSGYTLWVNTTTQILSYYSAAATSWIPLGAVFK